LPRSGKGILAARAEIFELLKGKHERLHNVDQGGGYGDERRANRELVFGPDLGGETHGQPIYLPAYKRYSGRFFTHLESVSPHFWQESQFPKVEILLLSGLYGLLFWDELIQSYDCHLNDYVKRPSGRKPIIEVWSKVLTEALCELVQTRAADPELGRFHFVYDLLSESGYQDAIDWKRFAQCGVEIRHRLFQGLAGPDALPYCAQILASHLEKLCNSEEPFAYNTWEELRPPDKPPIRFGFERRIGENKEATREGDLDEARVALRAEIPELEFFGSQSPGDVLYDLVLAEHSWIKAAQFDNYDWGSLIVSYAGAVERFCKEYVPECPDKATLGQTIRHINNEAPRIWRNLIDDLRKLNDLRVPGAHPGPQKSKDDVQQARRLSISLIAKAIQIWKTETERKRVLGSSSGS
jgi:hypothetical protein